MAKRDHYQTLGLTRRARKAEIERTAKRLLRLNHPSLNPGDPAAAGRYDEIALAYGVLSDPAQRRAYDRAGAAPAAPAPSTVPDIWTTVHLSFEEAVSGTRRVVSFQGRFGCEACEGRGCRRCGSSGEEDREATVKVEVPAGIDSGGSVRIARPAGALHDLIVVANVAPHAFFRRIGNNLHCEVPITITEAALGAKIEVPTLAGHALVRVLPGTQSGQQLRLRAHGVPSLYGAGAGDLYVQVNVVTPETRDQRVRELLRELGRALGREGAVRASLFPGREGGVP